MLDLRKIQIVNILNACADIEKMTAEMYDFLAEKYKDIPEFSRLFVKTACEERNHECQFKLAIKNFIPSICDITMADDVVARYAASVRDTFENLRKPAPALENALEYAILLETEFRQFHMDMAVLFEDQFSSKLFGAMMAADDNHIERLKQAHRMYGQVDRDKGSVPNIR